MNGPQGFYNAEAKDGVAGGNSHGPVQRSSFEERVGKELLS
jgi:hypothetical protein